MGQIIGIHTQTGAVMAYTAEPTQADRSGGILLLHDIWGLDDHTKGVADRLARRGYHVVAPNLLAGTAMERSIRPELREGLYNPNRRLRVNAQMMLQQATGPLRSPQIASIAIMRAHACFEYMYNQPRLGGRVSLIGFGFGGTHTFSLAIRENRISAAVAFYPQASYVSYELRHISCPILMVVGDHDANAVGSVVRMDPIMKNNGIDSTLALCEGAGPYFFDESMPGAYDEHAAQESWARTLSFLQRNMG